MLIQDAQIHGSEGEIDSAIEQNGFAEESHWASPFVGNGWRHPSLPRGGLSWRPNEFQELEPDKLSFTAVLAHGPPNIFSGESTIFSKSGDMMTTTGLAAELIVVGLQALLWISMLLIGLFGHDKVFSTLSNFAASEAVFTVALLAVAYTIGVVVDRICLVAVVGLGIENYFCKDTWFRSKAKGKVNDQFLRVYQATNNLDTYYNYVIRRTRLACSTGVNSGLLALAIGAAYWMRPAEFGSRLVFIGLFGSVSLFSLVSFFAYGTLAFAMIYQGERILLITDVTGDGGDLGSSERQTAEAN